MRVAYTIEQSWHRVPGGTAVAALEVARELETMRVDGESDAELVGVSLWHLRQAPSPWTPPIPVRRRPLPPKLGYDIWTRVARSPSATRVLGSVAGVGSWPDLVHATAPLVPPTRVPMVATVHDLAFLHDASRFTSRGASLMSRCFDIVRDQARLVLCSSESTIGDVVEAGVSRQRTRLVPLGVRVSPATVADIAAARSAFGLEGPYVLAVGTREPRKNLARLGAAHKAAGLEARLVIVGPEGWGEGALGAERLEQDALTTGFVRPDVLRALYAGASVFCYPSLQEGFGLPILEAMAQGCPVVTSSGTSTEEVAGGAAVLVDPLDVDDIARGLREAMDRRTELGGRGRRRAEEMTWRRTAELTLAAYHEVVVS